MNRFTCILPLFVAVSALAQDVPPPPKPPADGPTLEVTMKYIQDRLNGEGKVSYRLDGSIVANSTVNAVADVTSCTLSFTRISEFELSGHSEGEVKLSFRDVDKLLVESIEDLVRRTRSEAGLDQYQLRYSPTTFVVTLVLSSGKTATVHGRSTDLKGVVTETDYPQRMLKEPGVYFREEDAAQRMAKAMVHAVELCGGGNKDPF